MCIGLSLGLGMRLGLGGQVLRLGLGLCMSVGMHMRLGLQVLSLCLSFQALSMSGEALSLGRDLEVARLGGPLEALGMQVLGMGLEGLRLSFEGFGGVGQGMSFLGSLRVHAAAAALACRLTSLRQLGGGHALHAVPLQAIGDDQSAWLHSLLRLLLLLAQLLLGDSCSYGCDSGGRQAGRGQRYCVYS